MFPHGGPYSRDTGDFDWWAQFLATRGYVVLQPQFRGSTGFGADLFRAGHKQWGRGMQDDITAGVRDLVDKGSRIPDASASSAAATAATQPSRARPSRRTSMPVP